jgi:hypothetical protein
VDTPERAVELVLGDKGEQSVTITSTDDGLWLTGQDEMRQMLGIEKRDAVSIMIAPIQQWGSAPPLTQPDEIYHKKTSLLFDIAYRTPYQQNRSTPLNHELPGDGM